ncbi:MAG: ABC transporter substrate-binding protein [Desulfobacterales bacterium]|nr:ABC transporter substrate-binding protein [Desulfobacterales bacterium]
MTKKFSLFMAVVLALFMISSENVFAKEFINGIDANFPPFAYVDKAGKPGGFDIDSVDWIAKKMGFTVKHQPLDWDGIIPNLVAKKIDFIASGMSITPERQKVVNFSIPYWTIKQVFVTKKDSKLTLDQVLKGKKRLGVQRGTSEAEWLKDTAAKKGWDFELVYYDSAPLAVEDVVNGRIAAAAMDDAPAMDAAGKKPVKILGTFGMHDEEFGYAVRKQDTELLETLNKGLKMLMADPYWDELVKKYLRK